MKQVIFTITLLFTILLCSCLPLCAYGSSLNDLPATDRFFAPPCSVTYLSDLNWADEPVNGSGPVRINQSNSGEVLAIRDKEYEFGLGVHAHSVIVYQIDGSYQYFRAIVGVDNGGGGDGSVQFEVYTDGKLAFQSPAMSNSDPGYALVLNVVGVNELQLVVRDGGDNNYFDHADWADAKLEVCYDECIAGTPCDDADACTVGDVLDANCNCTGTTFDSDQDSVCDMMDQCPGSDDRLDTDGDGIPDACDNSLCANTYLTGLDWAYPPLNGLGKIEINQSVGTENPEDGRPLQINDQVFSHGLGVHAPSEIGYQIGGAYEYFRAGIGVDDEVDNGGSVQFEVYGDDLLLFQSPVLTGEDDPLAIAVNIIGVNTLKLVVNNGGDNDNNDHADWAIPLLENCSDFCAVGTPCDDGDACTTGDAYNAVCECEGTLLDADQDEVCDRDDICPGGDDAFDADQDGIPDACDDTPCADFHLSDVKMAVRAVNGSGPVMLDQSNEGNTMSINGQTYERGLGVHAYSKITYLLNGQYEFFQAFVGVDEESGEEGSVQFEVYVDGLRIFQSPVMTRQQDALPVSVNILGVNELTLIVNDAGDENFSDHANWADAQLLCKEVCTPGFPCDDGYACTLNDVWDNDCNCAGVPMDSDQDGICDDEDQCPGGDDRLDADQDGIPDDCAGTPGNPTEGDAADRVYIPNVFSPNNDGVNDSFTIFAPEVVSIVSLHIFDRWGQLVFEQSRGSGTEQVWNGNDRRNMPVSEGVYIYRILVEMPTGKTEIMYGDVTVLW